MRKHREKKAPLAVSSLKHHVGASVFRLARVKYAAYASRFKKFTAEYRLPVIASAIFLLIVSVFGVQRQFERRSLLELINTVSANENGYSNLISADQIDQFTRNDTSESEEALNQTLTNDDSTRNANVNSTQNTSASFPINNDDWSNDGGSGSGDGGSGSDPPPSPPFAASIESFAQTNVTLQCNNPSKPKKGTCSKVYGFSAGVRSSNGPGAVSYTWQSDADGGSGSGSFSAASGTSVTALSREVVLACNKSSSFSMSFIINAPSQVASNNINVSHNCNEL